MVVKLTIRPVRRVEQMHHESRVIRRDHLIFEQVGSECVVYDGRRKQAHHLNPTLAWIWHRCDGTHSTEAISAAFTQHFHVENGNDFVLDGLKQLSARELLETVTDAAGISLGKNRTVSRRTVLAAGAVVAPAMISMVVPTPAAAKSHPDKDKDK
jgi:hypothetical protein